MIMTAADLLSNNPDPSEQEIRHALEGNFCRCTGYHNIVKSIQYAANKINKKEPVHRRPRGFPALMTLKRFDCDTGSTVAKQSASTSS